MEKNITAVILMHLPIAAKLSPLISQTPASAAPPCRLSTYLLASAASAYSPKLSAKRHMQLTVWSNKNASDSSKSVNFKV